ncbi:MAG TPA: ABC transporter ATP-binding protein, partial [Halieaceae bacterium]|nr:ABC transporter ATP-binding protein [Halieaceae bacterium]
GFNFRGDSATQPIAPFSGGEKARLALALVVWQRPNLLVLDEPTNHLDLDMRNAMEMALQGYEGALILVSHDRHLLRNTADELLLVHDGVVEDYDDDLRAYEKWVLASYRSGDAPTASVPAATEASAKERRQQAAAQRERLRPLQREITQTEKAMGQAEQALQALQARLADPALYEGDSAGEVAELVKQEGALQAEQARLEELWLAQQEELEAI